MLALLGVMNMHNQESKGTVPQAEYSRRVLLISPCAVGFFKILLQLLKLTTCPLSADCSLNYLL